ncbi:hypothetical protein Angca_008897, partial [Angiostrongylus cantonensis]
MKSSLSQKKRKSDVHLDASTTHPRKKERPWYAEEASLESTLAAEKDRRKSIIDLGKGLLKKMRSSSALKDRNSDVTIALMSSSTSTIPVLKQASLNTKLDPMPEDQSSQCETSSAESCESSEVLPASFHRNKDLVRLIATVSTQSQSTLSSEHVNSFHSETCSSENMSHLGSVASLCTPSRQFGRGQSRGSVRSMPPESDLIRGLCNSTIRRTMSSASDSLASPQRFTRARSIRLREKLALSASMADLPEEEAAPITSLAESTGEAKTPVDAHKGSSRRTSIVWSTLRSKSRIFGSKKVGDGTPLSGSIKDVTETPTDRENMTPSGRSLRRMSASSASIQKKVSSALKKSLGFRGSNPNLAGDQVRGTPAGILKRSSTNSKDRYRLPPSIARRCSDVSGIVAAELERQVRVEERRKDAEEARMYMEKVLVSREPIMQILYRDGYDAVVVDVSATGLPVSSIAKDILCGDSGNELHKIGMFKPYKDGVLKTQPGKPDIIYIVSEKDEEPDKRVRVGVATGMREAFGCEQLKKIVLYPFCISHEEPFTDYVIQQFLLASFKAFTWNQKEKVFDGSLTLAGVTEENCAQIHRLYEEFLNLEIRTRITAYENLSLPATE